MGEILNMTDNDKFAYLVMAHKADYTFQKLLSAIDDVRNDIYLHIDKKSDIDSFKKLAQNVKQSNLFLLREREWNGGTFSN